MDLDLNQDLKNLAIHLSDFHNLSIDASSIYEYLLFHKFKEDFQEGKFVYGNIYFLRGGFILNYLGLNGADEIGRIRLVNSPNSLEFKFDYRFLNSLSGNNVRTENLDILLGFPVFSIDGRDLSLISCSYINSQIGEKIKRIEPIYH